MQSQFTTPRFCRVCSREFIPQSSNAKRGKGTFCSKSCATTFRNLNKPKRTYAPDDFWQRVKKQENGCWLWQGPIDDGYGSVNWEGRDHRAHRIAYALTYGPIPNGLYVCHRCDVCLCVRPDHLFLGTAKDNAIDAVKKKRNYCGERHHKAKLTLAKVIKIRANYQLGDCYAEIGRQYGVTAEMISAIIRRLSWKNA